MRAAALALLLLLTACGSANGDLDCDPGGRVEDALVTDGALQSLPAGVRELQRVQVESDADSRTGECNDPFLSVDLDAGIADALVTYRRHVEQAGWTVTAVVGGALDAERRLADLPAELRVNVREDGTLRVRVTVLLPD